MRSWLKAYADNTVNALHLHILNTLRTQSASASVSLTVDNKGGFVAMIGHTANRL